MLESRRGATGCRNPDAGLAAGFWTSELARGLFLAWGLGPIADVGQGIGFALLGESLLAVAGWPAPPKGTKRSCPCIRVSLRSASLTPVTLQGPAATGHPCRWRPRPNAALAASMPLNPLHATCARPPGRGGSVVRDGPCNELVVRPLRDRRVGNAKLTHRFWWARSDSNCGIDCGGKCFAVSHPTKLWIFGA